MDHGVAAGDHVVEGKYRGGALTVTAGLKGTLGKRVVFVERGDVLAAFRSFRTALLIMVTVPLASSGARAGR